MLSRDMMIQEVLNPRSHEQMKYTLHFGQNRDPY